MKIEAHMVVQGGVNVEVVRDYLCKDCKHQNTATCNDCISSIETIGDKQIYSKPSHWEEKDQSLFCVECGKDTETINKFMECKDCADFDDVKEDVVNKPSHYHKGGIDLLTYVDGKLSKERIAGFYQMNILKYVARYTEKNGVQDLEKAEFYLKKLIELEQG